MNEEVMRVLKMIEEGKISAEKGKELIDSLNKVNTNEVINEPVVLERGNTNYGDKLLRIKISSADGDKVNVQFPVKVITKILKLTGKLPMENIDMQGVDMKDLINTIIAALDNEVMGPIVDINSNDGDVIKIVIE